MKLTFDEIKDILSNSNLLLDSSFKDGEILGVTYDSRDVSKDYLFFCKGEKFNKKFLDIAVLNGANIYVAEKRYSEDYNYFIVKDIREAMAVISSELYKKAYLDIETIAITGTKGKTTVTYFLKNIIDEFTKKKSAIISTVETYTGVREEESHLTTPEAPLLHELFYEVKQSDIKYLTMEVTSQAYKTKRVSGIKFKHGMFLNISEDHISDLEHSDFEDYFNCKLELIKNVDDMLVNIDMEKYLEVKEACEDNDVKYYTYGINKDADYVYSDIIKVGDIFKFSLLEKDGKQELYSINMQGRFNVENAVAAIAMAKIMGMDYESIKRGLLKTQILGRMNVFEKNGVTIIVDYAHNKLSFSKLYESIKLDYPNRRIVSLGGGPGNKAYKRRQDFGEIVGAGSDHVILTAEDPQFENVSDICKDIIKYLPEDVTYEVIEDRKEAVEYAINNAKNKDVIVLLAKGEEDYQKVNGNFTYYESDLKIVKRLLEKEGIKC